MPINSEDVLRHVPHLRRHARLLSGSKDVGDEYVRIALELVVAEPERLQGGDQRILLFRAFHAVWSALNESGRRHLVDAITIEERCQVCMVRLRPQMFQELRLGEKIFHCGSCRRILYFQPKEQPAAT